MGQMAAGPGAVEQFRRPGGGVGVEQPVQQWGVHGRPPPNVWSGPAPPATEGAGASPDGLRRARGTVRFCTARFNT